MTICAVKAFLIACASDQARSVSTRRAQVVRNQNGLQYVERLAMARRRLKIAIATTGRFHVLDLARELHDLGHDVKFYSYVPRRRAERFGLAPECHVAMLPWLAPLVVMARVLGGTSLQSIADQLLWRASDWLVSMRMSRCDVLIAMSGVYVRALIRARRKFGAKCILERGSVHIEEQKRILDRIKALNPKAASVPPANVVRELQGYRVSDRIVVPSLHARNSFVARGIPPEKLFTNPYGADVDVFTPDNSVARDRYLLLFVGTWSYQKGVDQLVVAMGKLAEFGFKLVHVGAVGDAPLPREDWFHSHGTVDQLSLPYWYRRARCLILASRQDGFGLVLLQAAACGCPIIGSAMCGAPDLKQMTGVGVEVVPVDDPEAIVDAVQGIGEDGGVGLAMAMELVRKKLDWKSYAERYEKMLLEI